MSILVFLALGLFMGQNFEDFRQDLGDERWGWAILKAGYILLGLVAFFVVVLKA